jgi:predicted transposase/invertase (TIGR01784 family)
MKNLIRFDWAVKRLLRNKANFGILEGFLSELLNEDVKIDSILESESNKADKYQKFNKVDLLVQNSKGELIIIEIQNNREHDYLMRILFGTSILLVNNMGEGMMYSQIKKIISVNIVYFDLGQGDDYLYHGTTNFIGINKNDVLKLSQDQQLLYKTDSIAKVYPEYYIIKVNQFDEVAKNTLDEWIYFFKTEEIKDEFNAKGIKQAKKELTILNLSDSERREYEKFIEQERYEESLIVSNYRVGELKGEIKGKAEGKIEQQLEIATQMYKDGEPVEKIMKYTGLSNEEVQKLK